MPPRRGDAITPPIKSLVSTMSSAILFSTIEVTRQVFYRTSLSYAIVNLKPIVPGRK
jgi:hypothetical protein